MVKKILINLIKLKQDVFSKKTHANFNIKSYAKNVYKKTYTHSLTHSKKNTHTQTAQNLILHTSPKRQGGRGH